jgi:hypothetical protein
VPYDTPGPAVPAGRPSAATRPATAADPPRRPIVADLRRTAAVFNGFADADTSWLRLAEDTKPVIDLSRADHRLRLLRWLNSWGCRIRYPRAGEPAPFDTGVAAWWRSCRTALPRASLAQLTDAEIDAAAAAYQELAGVRVSAGPAVRTLGPTAAAKALYALRPRAIVPWDAAIARALHGRSRDGAAFGRHLRLGRQWARSLIAESGVDEDALPGLVGRPGVSLAKLLDEYMYVTITMASRATRPAGPGRAPRSRGG